MTRPEAENSHALKIVRLKQWGYFPQGYSVKSGTVSWTQWGDEKSSISIMVSVGAGSGNYIRLWYTHTSYWTGEKSDVDYNINILTTPCHYGGMRYWFQCPLVKNDKYCGRRVGVLYISGKYYGCRYCHNIAYQSQFEGGTRKGFVSSPDIEQVEESIKRYYYRGKPTRKYRRLMRMEDRFSRSLVMMAAKLDGKTGRLARGLL